MQLLFIIFCVAFFSAILSTDGLNAFLQRLLERAWWLFASIQAWGTLAGEFSEANSRCQSLLVHAASNRASVTHPNCGGSHCRRTVKISACADGGDAVMWHCKLRTNVKMSQHPVIGVNSPFKRPNARYIRPHEVGCLKRNSCAPLILSVFSRTAAARRRNAFAHAQ